MKKENNVVPHFEELEERLEMAQVAAASEDRCIGNNSHHEVTDPDEPARP